MRVVLRVVVRLAEIRCNRLSFDIGAIMGELISYFTLVMQEEEDQFIKIMQEEIEPTGEGPRASSHRIAKWKERIKPYFKAISREISRNYIESKVGISAANDEIYRKAIIIALGGGPSTAGPAGRSVWDEDYSGRVVSSIDPEQPLPPEFMLGGNQWFENAVKRMKVYFEDILEIAARALPSNIFFKNLIVS